MKTAQLSNKSPSEFAGILDPSIAQAFDVECADMLFQWELDREKEREERQNELLGVGAVTGIAGALGGSTRPTTMPTFDRSKVERW